VLAEPVVDGAILLAAAAAAAAVVLVLVAAAALVVAVVVPVLVPVPVAELVAPAADATTLAAVSDILPMVE
jgi:hypothetical protein